MFKVRVRQNEERAAGAMAGAACMVVNPWVNLIYQATCTVRESSACKRVHGVIAMRSSLHVEVYSSIACLRQVLVCRCGKVAAVNGWSHDPGSQVRKSFLDVCCGE